MCIICFKIYLKANDHNLAAKLLYRAAQHVTKFPIRKITSF